MTTLQIGSVVAAGDLAGDGGAHVVHSHHYHSALLRALYEAGDIDASALLADAAAASGVPSLQLPDDRAEGAVRLGIADCFKEAGLGIVDLGGLNARGEGNAVVRGSHFAAAWMRRYRASSLPICAASGAFLAAAASRGYRRSLEAIETRCAASGAPVCTFRLRPAAGNAAVQEVGDACEGLGRGVQGVARAAHEVAIGALFGAATTVTDADPIEVPGGPFTRLPATFYAGVTHRFEYEIPRVRGAKFGNLPGILLLEAAHRNGFHLFGELLRSPVCTGAPETEIRSSEEQLHLMLGVIESLGWGRWELRSFASGERLIARIADSYEAVAHQRLFGSEASPRCYVARGAAAALMNLLFREDGCRGTTSTASRYNELFRSPASFRAVETRCRAMGDDFCEIVANPLSI
jgi:predicted hydrocarbon binding protein